MSFSPRLRFTSFRVPDTGWAYEAADKFNVNLDRDSWHRSQQGRDGFDKQHRSQRGAGSRDLIQAELRCRALVHFQTEGEMAPTPSCYAVTGWRRTESGRPATNIRFSTATPMAASVCWAAKPRARSRGPISVL